jgi:hypothetical protein
VQCSGSAAKPKNKKMLNKIWATNQRKFSAVKLSTIVLPFLTGRPQLTTTFDGISFHCRVLTISIKGETTEKKLD